MSKDPQERILNACLDEILGGKSPPDLAPQIMRKLEAEQQATKHRLKASVGSDSSVMASALNNPQPASQPKCTPVVKLVQNKAERTRHLSPWWSLTVVAALAVLGVSVGFGLLSLMERGRSSDVANQDVQNGNPQEDHNSRVGEVNAADSIATQPGTEPGKQEFAPGSQLVKQGTNIDHDSSATLVDQGQNVFPKDNGIVKSTPAQPDHSEPLLQAKPMTQSEIVAAIDNGLQRIWGQHALEPAEAVDESEWCRRVVLALTGREATPQELKNFLAGPKDDRRSQFLQQLFGNDDVLDEYATVWSTKLASTLLGTPLAAESQIAGQDKPVAHLLSYLRRSLVENRPYDKIASQLLTAKGTIRPMDEGYDGASGFLIALYKDHGGDRDYKNTTARIARSFWGQRLQCAQCHDDQLAGLAQSDFWQLNVSLRDYKVVEENGSPRLARQPLGNDPIFYETLSGRLVAIKPPVEHVGDAQVSVRAELTRKVIADERFLPRAVNIVWSQLLGYGLVHPVDDMGPHNQSIDEQLLSELAEQFAANGQDLRKLIAWIMLSEAFDRPATETMVDDHPETGGKALFTRFYQRQRSSLSTKESLELVAKAYGGATDRSGAARRALLGKVAPASGSNLEIIDATNAASLSSWGIDESYSSTLERIAASKLDNQAKITHLFWLAVGRDPTSHESDICVKLLGTESESNAQILQDIWWAISPR